MVLPELVISEVDLKKLGEYSCSLPTGTTIGKRWRRNIHAFDGSGNEPEWQIGEYYELPEGDSTDDRGNPQVGIRWYWAVNEQHEVHRCKF